MKAIVKSYFNASMSGLPLRSVVNRCAPVLAYHSCFREVPPGVLQVDNVTPECIYEHVAVLKRHFRIVPIDEFCETRSRKGIAAITFDDGYKCVVEDALPVFEALDVPFTVFVNSSSFRRKPFWRHKLTYLAHLGLSDEFETFMRRVRKLAGQPLHVYSKDPSNHSGVVEEELDRFYEAKSLSLPNGGYLFDSARFLVAHPLVWYGNHTENHYVLASLSRAEQEDEIRNTRSFLARFAQIQISNVFSAPFGQRFHINGDTHSVLRDLNYKAILLNRGGVNPTSARGSALEVIERVHAERGDIGMQIKKECVRTLLRWTVKRANSTIDQHVGTRWSGADPVHPVD